jgi:2,3-dihydroxybenzoate-AMP ligase
MLEECTPGRLNFASRYRREGYWSGITLWRINDNAIRRSPNKAALFYGDTRLSYADLGERIEQLASQWLRFGLRPREHVVLQLPNGPSFIATKLTEEAAAACKELAS